MTDTFSSSPDHDLLARVSRAVDPAYDIVREIGRGGSGIVYRATDRRLKRSVALKILPPDLAFRADTRERFMREAETAARLSHPNIVPIFSVDEKDGLAWFVMAIVEGQNVGERVRAHGAVPFSDARRLLREVADALAYAHERGVVHRDIKPDNILIDGQTSRALVTDFGIARATTEGESRLTATGTAIGTPAYMSPEQCAGDRELDGRSDLYSLGAVAYYAITGQPPFDGPSTPVIMMKQVAEPPTPMSRYRSGIPADLDAIVMRLLEKDPADRFASGSELIDALDSGHVEPVRHKARMDTLSTFPRLPTFPGLPTVKMDEMFHPLPMMNPKWMAPQAKFLERQKRHEDKMRRREEKENSRPLPERIKSFRRHLASYVGSTIFLFGINLATSPEFAWAVFPALGMMMGLWKEGGGLWAAGARWSDVFGTSKPIGSGGEGAQLAGPAAVAGPGEITAEVLAGPRGAIARQAGADRRAIKDLVSRMNKAEREMLPDVEQTSENLYERIAELGRALHRLDGEIGPEKLPELDARISQTEKAEGTDADRRLRLLKRQREMLASLLESRDKLSEQYESAGLLLQNLKLDLIRMRSSGLQSGLAEVTSATQEARALSREIGYVLAAADELKEIDRDK